MSSLRESIPSLFWWLFWVLVALILILLAALLIHHFGGMNLAFHIGYFRFQIGVR